jgi:LysM repeat protein
MVVYFVLGRKSNAVIQPTLTATITSTATASLTPTPFTPTSTNTPEPTPTPFSYTVKLGDNCLTIAYSFKVSVQSIVLLNNLPADCSTLYENQKLLIPQPTPTPSPPATSTLTSGEATEAACEKYDYIVQENDTLSSIAASFNVPADAIRNYNGLVADIVRFGQKLIIPLCYRGEALGGPTPTPTIPPPYPAVNLLLPPDGAPFNLVENVISVQWASVGALRENEAYAVTIEDVTQGEGRKLVLYVVDTKAIVPESFLINDGIPHVLRWWVLTVRQTGTDDTGNPIWEPAGAASASRVFTWLAAVPAVTTTP